LAAPDASAPARSTHTKEPAPKAGAALSEPWSAFHTISVFVNNRPGVLVRVALVFSRRGYNIESLVVSPAAEGRFSRMTITCSGEVEALEQIIKQLQKLVDVVHAVDHTGDDAYATEIALVKVACPLDSRSQVLQIAEHYNARVVDYGQESLIFRIFGSSEKLDAFIALIRPYGLRELVRSGKILMARGLNVT
jgi:acetolactate synthase-1/3 small subunit